MRESGFCCAGCSYVYRLVHEHGLAGYYQIKDDITAPADSAVFEPRDYVWLEQSQRAAEASGSRIPELTVDVQGISCAGCVWLIERLFQQQPGARDVFVNAQYGSMRMRWIAGEFFAADFARKLQAFGYLVGPAGEAVAEPESRALVKRIGLCAAFAMNVMLFSLPAYFGMERTFEWASLFGLLSLLFGTLSFLVGGTYFLGRAIGALRERVMHIDLPIAIGIIGAYFGSLYGWMAGQERYIYFDFVSAFILLMLVGRWAQTAAVERNRRRLLAQQPKLQRVRLVSGGDAPPEQLVAGQRILLIAGQTLPVEARLEAVAAEFSLASINGEAEPRTFRLGQRIPAGAVNVGRAEVRLTTTQPWSESLLAQLLAAGDRAGERHALLEQIVRGYLIGIIGVALAAGVLWWFRTGDALRTGAVVTAVLVVSCPCAIGLAFPLADEMATIALRRRGVFVREADLWAKLGRVRKLVFDKTGTLTLETPVLLNPDALNSLDATARSALLALVRDNPHPISECLREELLASGRVDPLPGPITETIGQGVELTTATLNQAEPDVPITPVPGVAGAADPGPASDVAGVADPGPVPAVARLACSELVECAAPGDLAAPLAKPKTVPLRPLSSASCLPVVGSAKEGLPSPLSCQPSAPSASSGKASEGSNTWTLGKPDWRPAKPEPDVPIVPASDVAGVACSEFVEWADPDVFVDSLAGAETARISPPPSARRRPFPASYLPVVGSAKEGPPSPSSCSSADTVLAHNGTVVARFHFADRPRPDAAPELAALQARGLDLFILSGDRAEKVSALAAELGLAADHAIGDASPRSKAAWLDEHGADNVLMLGDGANDSLAFDRALCRGTPVIHRGVLERKADFYYLGRGIGGLRALFEVDRIRRRTHRVILIFSIAYNLLAVTLAVAGHMNPLLAAILMPVNSLLTLALVTTGLRPAFTKSL